MLVDEPASKSDREICLIGLLQALYKACLNYKTEKKVRLILENEEVAKEVAPLLDQLLKPAHEPPNPAGMHHRQLENVTSSQTEILNNSFSQKRTPQQFESKPSNNSVTSQGRQRLSGSNTVYN